MLKFLDGLKSTFLNRKFLGFVLIGIINGFNAAFFSWILHFFMQDNIAAYVGYFISLTVNYFLNSKIVFKCTLSFQKYIKFLLSYVPNFIIYFLVTFITINLMRLNQFCATILATAVGGPITYIIIKAYAFGNRDGKSRL